jgi:hypothetical protein
VPFAPSSFESLLISLLENSFDTKTSESVTIATKKHDEKKKIKSGMIEKKWQLIISILPFLND